MRATDPRPRAHAREGPFEADEAPYEGVVPAVGRAAVRLLQACVQPVFRGLARRTLGHRQPVGPQLRGCNLHEQRLNRVGAVLEITQSFEHEVATWKGRERAGIHVAIKASL
jgi:hypothetical protein